MRTRYFVLSAVLALLALGGCHGRGVESISGSLAEVEAAPEVVFDSNDWPWWRGHASSNQAAGDPPPTAWSEDQNLIWQAEVPGSGHASPIVSGPYVFVATAEDARESQSLFCFERDEGTLLWQREIHQGGFMHTHGKNTHASATPACDGQRVFTVFMVQHGIWVTAVGLDGEIQWQTKAGPFQSQHGYGSSPVIFESLVIVAGDNRASGFLAALHRETGEIVWRVPRANSPSYGTPVLANLAGRPQLLLSGHRKVHSYDPATGEELWSAEGPASTTANTVAFNDELVFAGGGYPQNGLMAIRGDGSGEVVWQNNWKVYVPSPLVAGDRLIVVLDQGIARCVEAGTGELLWEKRLGGNFSASPVVAGQHVYVPNERGTMFVFKATDDYQQVARNELTDGGFASPTICGGRIYVRTSSHLYCIGEQAADAPQAGIGQ